MDRRTFLETLGGVAAFAAVGFPAKATQLETSPKEKIENFVVCPILRGDWVNENKRMYPTSVLHQAVEQFKEGKVSTLGQIGYPQNTIQNISKVSHEIKDLWVVKDSWSNDDVLIVEVKILETPNGKVLWSLLKERKVLFRTFGLGDGKVNEDGILVIGENYRLVGIHAVSAEKATTLGNKMSLNMGTYSWTI